MVLPIMLPVVGYCQDSIIDILSHTTYNRRMKEFIEKIELLSPSWEVPPDLRATGNADIVLSAIGCDAPDIAQKVISEARKSLWQHRDKSLGRSH